MSLVLLSGKGRGSIASSTQDRHRFKESPMPSFGVAKLKIFYK